MSGSICGQCVVKNGFFNWDLNKVVNDRRTGWSVHGKFYKYIKEMRPENDYI